MKTKLNQVELNFVKFVNSGLVTDDEVKVLTGNFNLKAIAYQRGELLIIKTFSRNKPIWVYIYDLDKNMVLCDNEV